MDTIRDKEPGGGVTKQIRIYLTVREETRSNLEAWAEAQGRNLTNLANWLIEKAVNDAIVSGELKKTEVDPSTDPLDRVRQFFEDVADGKYYADQDLATLANELDVSVDHLIAHQNCFKKKRGKIGN